MSTTVGAALKRVALALLGEPKVFKKVCMAVLILLIAIIMPIVAVIGVLSGDIEIDTNALMNAVMTNLSAEERARLQEIEDTMNDIEREMKAAGFGERAQEAQVIYILAFSDKSSDSGFIAKLVDCFSSGQTDLQLINTVNSRFGVNISLIEFNNVMNGIRAVYIDTSGYISPETKNSTDLVAWAIEAQEAGWGYVWGTYGSVLTRSALSAKVKQYPDNVGVMEDFIKENWLGCRTADCVGLIKGYGWLNAETKAIEYGANGMPDVSANGMFNNAVHKGSISTMPDTPGLAVWKKGHIGIYIGDGYVIEAMNTRYGVRKTQLSRGTWTHWLEIPYISYDNVTTEQSDRRTVDIIGY